MWCAVECLLVLAKVFMMSMFVVQVLGESTWQMADLLAGRGRTWPSLHGEVGKKQDGMG